MKIRDLKRILELPEGIEIRAGRKHLVALDRKGKLLMIFSKSMRGSFGGPWYRYALRKLAKAISQ